MNKEKNIDFACEQLVNIVHGEVTRIFPTGKIIKKYGIETEKKGILELDADMQKKICLREKKEIPEIIMESKYVIYAILYCGNERILIGPVSIQKNLEEVVFSFSRQHGIKSEDNYNLGYCELKVFGSAVLLGYHILSGNLITLEELWNANGNLNSDLENVNREVSKIIFERQEYDTPHNPYDQEIREMNSITQGNVEMLKASIRESYKGQEGRMAEDEIRQEKNIAIVVITLASRAAIRGGLLPEKSFSMVDAYILLIERMTDPIKIRALTRKAEYDFAEQVAKTNRLGENEIVEHTKNYIFQHLHDEIVIGNLGKQIGVNNSYLSKLFHKTEGITIQLFVRNEKIKLAENMLRYSEYSIRDIANYLSFCSQSHFGKAFKEQTGLTPAKYRKMYQRRNQTK